MNWLLFIVVFVWPVMALVLCYKIIKVLEGKKYKYIRPVREERINDMDIITFEIGLPVSKSHDVVGGKLTVTRTPHEPLLAEEVIDVPLPAEKALVQAPQDSQVTLSYSVVDDAGNLSTPVVAEFQALDTFAPILEGELTVTAVGEEAAPEVPMEPESEVPMEPETPVNPAPPEFMEPDNQPTSPV